VSPRSLFSSRRLMTCARIVHSFRRLMSGRAGLWCQALYHEADSEEPRMQTVLVTGASGGIGARLRRLLKGAYPNIRWSDLKAPSDLAADETFVQADLAVMGEVER